MPIVSFLTLGRLEGAMNRDVSARLASCLSLFSFSYAGWSRCSSCENSGVVRGSITSNAAGVCDSSLYHDVQGLESQTRRSTDVAIAVISQISGAVFNA